MSILFRVLHAFGRVVSLAGESVCRFATMQYAKRSVVPTVTVGADPWFDLSTPAGEAAPNKCGCCFEDVPVNDQSWCDDCATASPWETEHCLQCDRIVFNDGSHKCEVEQAAKAAAEYDPWAVQEFVCCDCGKSLVGEPDVRADFNFSVYCEKCYREYCIV